MVVVVVLVVLCCVCVAPREKVNAQKVAQENFSRRATTAQPRSRAHDAVATRFRREISKNEKTAKNIFGHGQISLIF